jgi:YVTN family beta-propeller protein
MEMLTSKTVRLLPLMTPASLLVVCCMTLVATVHGQSKGPTKIGHPSLLSPHARPILEHGKHVFVVNTPGDTVDIIDKATLKVVKRIDVGVDPVSLALRPDGKELWVSNHVSDTVSVIDTDPKSPTYQLVVATIQDIDLNTKSTNFDEPVGVAFASNDKAYVALSSANKIAIIDVKSRKVVRQLGITNQDPRAIVVRKDKLYVIPLESGNKTQLSGGTGAIDGKLVTYDAKKHREINNVLDRGVTVDIVKHPKAPDHDLYIFDTRSDRLIKTVDTLGTLLYGLDVDSQGNVYIAQADARNDVNGRAGTKKHGLKEMENRAFLNQITKVGAGASKGQRIELEPLPPNHPKKGTALATPFAIQISKDDATLFATAAGSDVLFTVDAKTGSVLGRVTVDAGPRGLALESNASGKPIRAWVFNALANTVSVVEIASLAAMTVKAKIVLEDPTPLPFKRGRIAFNTARASTTATFSCASCHPDGHTDQLLWVLDTPIVTNGTQIQPRSTMPARGLRDTAPYHWDGIPGDPYGGLNSANLNGNLKPNSDIRKPESSTRFLIDAGLASTMMMVGSKDKNNERKKGLLSRQERNDMAVFILNIPYPPAPQRPYTNKLSESAELGFKRFNLRGDLKDKLLPSTLCGDCHRMPFFTSTNTGGDNGMDAPTWRGANDRYLILPQGRANIVDFTGTYSPPMEEGMWAGLFRQKFGESTAKQVWSMVVESSTGFSGSFGRQVTLSKQTAGETLTGDMIAALELSASEGGVILQVEGQRIVNGKKVAVVFQYDGKTKKYVTVGKGDSFDRKGLFEMAGAGSFIGTFTGRHGVDDNSPQPAIWTRGSIHEQRGSQIFPRVYGSKKTLVFSGRHIKRNANVLINGRKDPTARVTVGRGDIVGVRLAKLPSQKVNFLQIQNPGGRFSNDFFFYSETPKEAIARRSADKSSGLLDWNLRSAVRNDDLVEAQIAVEAGASVTNKIFGQSPLQLANFYRRSKIAKYLRSKGAR